MTHILIVDDEKMILEGIKRAVGWEEIGITQVSTAVGYEGAVKIIADSCPDLVLTDITLGTDRTGLDLLQETKRLKPECVVVMLTCHENFSYLQTALRMGAFDYVLKNSSKSELTAVLQRACQYSLEVRSKNISHSQTASMLYTLSRTSGCAVLRRIMENTHSEEDFRLAGECFPALASMSSFYLSLTQFASVSGVSETQKAAQKNGLALVSAAFHGQALQAPCFCCRDYVVCIHPSSGLTFPTPDSIVEAYRELNLTDKDVQIFTGISSIAFQISELPDAFRKAQQAIAESFYERNAVCVCHGNRAPRPFPDSGKFSTYALYVLLCDSKFDDAQRHVEQILSEIEVCRYAPEDVRECILEIFAAFNMFLKPEQQNVRAVCALPAPVNQIVFAFFQESALRCWMKSTMETLFSFLRSTYSPKTVSVMEKCQEFIQKNLSRPLTLKEIAESVGFSPNYLSTYFSDKMKMSLSEYITLQRMERAKALLRDPEIRISEIAYATGYESPNYFSRKFKQVLGLSPQQFRESLY